jgi:hypothetical protein
VGLYSRVQTMGLTQHEALFCFLLEHAFRFRQSTVVSGRLNVVRGLKQTNQIVSFERTRHMIGLWTMPVRAYLAIQVDLSIHAGRHLSPSLCSRFHRQPKFSRSILMYIACLISLHRIPAMTILPHKPASSLRAVLNI